MNNQSSVTSPRWSFKKVLITVIAVVLILSTFASTAFAGLTSEYSVVIKDGSSTTTVTTNETEAIDILSDSNITLNENDKLDISAFTSGEGGTIVIDRLNTVNIEFEGVITPYEVYATTVADAFNEIGITVEKEDKINYELTDAVTDGMVITLKKAYSVSLKVDGKTTKYAITTGTVADVLDVAKVTLGKDDYTKPSLSSKITKNTKITVYRVTYKTVEKTETVKYKTTRKTDKTLEIGETKTVTKGVNGSADVTYKVKYVNGKEKSKTEITRVVTKKATNAVVKVGSNSTVKSNGVTKKGNRYVGEKISGRYTHYCACGICGSGRGVTASGKKVYNGMANPYYIACNWLPLGSVVSVDGTNYTVVDRGGSGLSSVGRIDIFTPEGHAACYKYGVGSCSITVVRIGW